MLMFDKMIKDENVSTRVRASTEQKTSAQNFGPKTREINRSKGHSRALDQVRITIEVQPHRLACQNLSAEGIRARSDVTRHKMMQKNVQRAGYHRFSPRCLSSLLP